MKRLLLLPAMAVLFTYSVKAAVGDIVETTVNFSEVEAIQGCSEPNSISTFTVGDFTFEFTPGKEDGESLCYKDFSDYGKAIYFWLGDFIKNSSPIKVISGDAIKITNDKGHYIQKVKVNCLDIFPSNLNYAFFTTYDKEGVYSATEQNNTAEDSDVFYHLSKAGPHDTPYVAITSVVITTKITEETEDPTPPTPPVADDDEFAIELADITFEESGAGKSLMNFKLTVKNPGNVSQYLMVVCDPDDSKKEYFRGTFDGNSFHNNDQPQGVPAKEAATSTTINGRVPLDNLNTDDDTPIAISITPQYETYTHAETPTVPKSTVTGASESVARESNLPVQYYNLNGAQTTHPAPGTPYIQRQGNSTRKVIIR